MEISFCKAQSLNCDRVLITKENSAAEPDRLARFLLRRQASIGGDRLILLRQDKDQKFDCITTRLSCFAADGKSLPAGEEELRCAAAYLVFREKKEGRIRFCTDTASRTVEAYRQGRGQAEVLSFLPPPDIDAETLGLRCSKPLLGRTLDVLGFPYPVYAVGIDDQVFAVVFEFGTALERLRAAEVGLGMSLHPCFSRSPTVVFVSRDTPRRLFVRLWDPLIGEPPASASAAAAAFSVACLLGLCPVGGENSVRMRGGEVRITAASQGGGMTVTASASFCFEGKVTLDLLTGETE